MKIPLATLSITLSWSLAGLALAVPSSAQVGTRAGGSQPGRTPTGLVNLPPLIQQPVVPTAGGPGTTLTVSADFSPLLAGYQPDDVICITNDEVEDEQFLWGRCTALGASVALAEIQETHPYPVPRRLDLVFGSGGEVALDSIDGVIFYEGPAYVWRSSGNAPTITTSNTFLALPSSPAPYSDPCEDPPTTITQPFKLDPDGCLRARVPGGGPPPLPKACLNDQLSLTLYLEVVIGGTPQSLLVELPWTDPLVDSKLGWHIALDYILNPLNTELSTINCFADYVNGFIEICPFPGTTITKVGDFSGFKIQMDPTKHTQFSVRQGDVDEFFFEDGFLVFDDVTDPEISFIGWLYNVYGALVDAHPLLKYDEQDCDRWLYDTTPNGNSAGNLGTKLANGMIRSAVVEVRIKGHSCQTDTDSINFGWDGDPAAPFWLWGIGMVQMSELLFTWNPGDEATICFDLCQLPSFNGNLTSILHELGERDVLDFMISDDTAVDYVELKVLRCNP